MNRKDISSTLNDIAPAVAPSLGTPQSPFSKLPEIGAYHLSYSELVAACRNFGIDLTYGCCACVFYTGWKWPPHDDHCETDVSLKGVIGDLIDA